MTDTKETDLRSCARSTIIYDGKPSANVRIIQIRLQIQDGITYLYLRFANITESKNFQSQRLQSGDGRAFVRKAPEAVYVQLESLDKTMDYLTKIVLLGTGFFDSQSQDEIRRKAETWLLSQQQCMAEIRQASFSASSSLTCTRTDPKQMTEPDATTTSENAEHRQIKAPLVNEEDFVHVDETTSSADVIATTISSPDVCSALDAEID